MKPWILRISARLAFMRDAGISTNLCRACTALRMRVRKSAIGSVMIVAIASRSMKARLPACFADAGDLPLECQGAELIATEAELAVVTAWATRQRTTAVQAHAGAVARQTLQALRITGGFESSTPLGILLNHAQAFCLSRNQACSCHTISVSRIRKGPRVQRSKGPRQSFDA